MADAPAALELLERGDGLLQRDFAAPVQEVHVESVGVQAAQARVAGGERPVVGRVGGHHLADQEHIVAAAGDRLADEPLAGAAAVELGGVDQRDPQVEAGAQRVHFDLRRMTALAQVPGAHAEDGDRFAGREVDCAHRKDGHGCGG